MSRTNHHTAQENTVLSAHCKQYNYITTRDTEKNITSQQ